MLLDCWRVSHWEGAVHGREGQRIAWARPEVLDERRFLPADKAIITAARLPALYLISPDPGPDLDAFLATLDARRGTGVRLFQLHCREIPLPRYRLLVREAFTLCERYDARLLLNSALGQVLPPEAHRLHLTSTDLLVLKRHPLTHDWLIAASCHDAREIAKAARLALDFIVLGPVLPTPTHPDAPTLGWTSFTALVRRRPPAGLVLGGLGPSHLPLAWRSGAQGIAAIRGYGGVSAGKDRRFTTERSTLPIYDSSLRCGCDVHHTRVRRSPYSPR